MKNNSKHTGLIKNSVYLIAVEKLIFLLAIVISLYTWLKSVDFTPDSTNYIVAGKNLIDHHALFVYTNWPSHSLLFAVEPFTDFAPGLSIFFSVFYLLIGNLYSSIVFSQACYIILFYFAFRFIFKKIRIQMPIQIGFWLLIPFFPPFIGIFQYYLTETLFIAISLFIAGLTLDPLTQFKLSSKRFWLILVLIFISASVRFVGALNVLWVLIPILYRPISIKEKRVLVTVSLLFSVGAPLLWFLRNYFLYHLSTNSHAFGKVFHSGNLEHPLLYLLYTTYGMIGKSAILICVFGLIIAIGILPNFLSRHYQNPQKTNELLIYQTLLVNGLCLTGFVYFVSLFAYINRLDNRLLAPSFSIGFVFMAFLLSRYCALNKVLFTLLLICFLSLTWLNLNTSPSIELIRKGPLLPSIKEKSLEKVFTDQRFSQSSGFYTEDNFKYQLYANSPHRILFVTESISSPEKIEALFNNGRDVYFVFKEHSEHRAAFTNNSKSVKDICTEYFDGYVLFFKNGKCRTP